MHSNEAPRKEEGPILEAVKGHASRATLNQIYKGTHMRGSVWPSKRLAVPADPTRPLTKREKRDLRAQAQAEGKPNPISTPRRLRNAPAVAHPGAVEAWLKTDEASRAETPEQLILALGRGAKFATPVDMDRAARRVARYTRRLQAGLATRVPTHIKHMAVVTSAAVQAIVARFPEEASEDMVRGVEDLQSRFGYVPAAA